MMLRNFLLGCGVASVASLRVGAPMRVAPVRLPSLKVSPRVARFAGLATTAAVAVGKPAMAVAAAAASKPHLKDTVVAFLRASGFSDAAIIATIAAMPVVELRGAIPVGAIMGLPLPKVFVLAVAGNMVPIAPLLFALRSPFVQRLLAKPLAKARHKSSEVLGDGSTRWWALAAFVGVPFPGTGAWTGGMIAFVLGMGFAEGVSAIFAGVVAAGLIVSALTSAGTAGAAVVAVALVAVLGGQQLASRKGDTN